MKYSFGNEISWLNPPVQWLFVIASLVGEFVEPLLPLLKSLVLNP